jgi:molybdenum cofactor cytidylyltransferase
MITAIILAAGESRRMQTPKALLKIGDEVFAECIARKCNEAGISVIYIITGAHREEIQQQMRGKYEVDFIFNFRYPEGQLSSLKEGLRNLPTGSSAALVWPVDQPLVRVDTVKLLLKEHEAARKHVTIPVYDSRHGHPVIYDVTAIHTALSLKAPQTAKELQTIYANDLLLVNVADEGVIRDIDRPEDFQKYITDGS